MGILGAILGVLRSLPKLLDIIEGVAKYVMDWMDEERKRKAQEQLKQGVADAKEKKDTSKLEDQLGK